MFRYALIRNGAVVEERLYKERPTGIKVIAGEPMLRPIEVENPTIDPLTQKKTLEIVVQADKVIERHVVSDLPKEQINTNLARALAAHRYEREIAGLLINDMLVQTDRESRANLLSARTVALEAIAYDAAGRVQPNPDLDDVLLNGVTWKAATGFVTMQAAVCVFIANKVFFFVRKLFDAEKKIFEKISDYGNLDEVIAAYDALVDGGK